MIEIIGAVYLGSLCGSAVLVLWQYLHIRRQFASEKLQMLNRNLEKIGMYWSVTQGSFNPLQDGNPVRDRQLAVRSLCLTGLLGLGSLPGFLLLAAVILSLRFLVGSRLEKAVFQSHISTESLSSSEIKIEVENLLRK